MNRFLITFLVLITMTVPISGQSMFPNQRDDSYPLLGLKRAQGVYEKAKNEFARAEKLLDQKLISEREFEVTKSAFLDAEVNYQQSLLVLLFEQQYISVKEAVKFRDEDGRKFVRLTLENTSGAPAEYRQLLQQTNDDIINALDLNSIYNVYVSLSNGESAIISKPYERKIRSIVSGKPVTVEFELLQDVDELSVNIIYGNGSTRNPKIFLEKDDSANRVLIQTEQFAQEVELNGSAKYGLDLELFSSADNTYRLEVVNLPQSINRYFVDPGTNARMSQIKFNESANTRRAELEVFLPDRPGDDIQIDSAMPFYVVALPKDSPQIDEIRRNRFTEAELIEMGVGYARLELIPRGVGKLIVKAPQLYTLIEKEHSETITFRVQNDGTRRLNNVEFELDAPFGWEVKTIPNVIQELDIREEVEVQLIVKPSEQIPVGKYEIRMKTTSVSHNQPVTAATKTFITEIPAEANVWGTVLLFFVIVGMGGGIVWFGIRLSKK